MFRYRPHFHFLFFWQEVSIQCVASILRFLILFGGSCCYEGCVSFAEKYIDTYKLRQWVMYIFFLQ